jgi:hypothetical protein
VFAEDSDALVSVSEEPSESDELEDVVCEIDGGASEGESAVSETIQQIDDVEQALQSLQDRYESLAIRYAQLMDATLQGDAAMSATDGDADAHAEIGDNGKHHRAPVVLASSEAVSHCVRLSVMFCVNTSKLYDCVHVFMDPLVRLTGELHQAAVNVLDTVSCSVQQLQAQFAARNT